MKIAESLRLALKKVLSLKFGQVNTDKGVLLWDGDKDLEVGDEVFMEIEGEDEPQSVETGDYVTEDGKTIKVVDGKVAEIIDPAAEVASEEPEEESAEPAVEMAEEDPAEPAAEPVDEPETEDEPQTEEDRIAALEARLDEITNGINGIVNAIAALEARIADVEAKLVSVEAPAADPVEDKPQEEEVKQSRMSYLRKK